MMNSRWILKTIYWGINILDEFSVAVGHFILIARSFFDEREEKAIADYSHRNLILLNDC